MAKSTEFESLVRRSFGGVKGWAEAIDISRPTATKYVTDPLQMTLGHFVTTAVKCKVSTTELLDIIKKVYL